MADFPKLIIPPGSVCLVCEETIETGDVVVTDDAHAVFIHSRCVHQEETVFKRYQLNDWIEKEES